MSGDFTSYWVYVVRSDRGRADRGRLRAHTAWQRRDIHLVAAGSGVLDPGQLAEKQRLSKAIDRGEVTPQGIPPADGENERPTEPGQS